MTCVACGREARSDARFSDGCGLRIDAAATQGSYSPRACAPRAYTPRHVAEKILGSRAALEGERKQVTVLFVDVKGSTELAQQVDAEEWHAILDRFFHVLTEGVHRYEGTVNQYTGDGIMALFGAPIAHEDHAQRACHAALRLRDALGRLADELRLERGLDFAVRMGLKSGDVVVGRIGDDLRMDYTAQGHTVNLASRMEQLAGAGRICLSSHTARLVEGWFTLRSLGGAELKGVAGRTEVWELAGTGRLRSRFDVSRARGLSRFVGREPEMAVLEAALERARGGGVHSVGIVAEAGTGKSRLAHEFVERCRARGVPVTVSHCVAHGREVPLLPVMEMLRGILGVGEGDDDDATRDKVTGRLMRLDASLGEHVPFVLDFLGVPDAHHTPRHLDAEERVARLVDLLARLGTLRTGAVSPVGVFEDLHWIDEPSEAVLSALWQAGKSYGVLSVCTYRPEYHPPWGEMPGFERLELRPLAARSIDELLHDLLGPAARDAGLVRLVRERSGGNPFFVEEIVRALAEGGALDGVKGDYRLTHEVDAIAVPDSVQSVLGARIDRLGEREKAVLQAASVIGKRFEPSPVARLVERGEPEVLAALEALADAELVHEADPPDRDAWVFTHPLTQEVAYEGQLRDARRARHRTLARVLAERLGAKPGEKAALVAQHWEAGGELLEAGRCYQRAAEWIEGRNFREGARQWRRLMVLVDRLPESAERDELSIEARGGLLRAGLRLGASDSERAELQAEITRLAARSPSDIRTRVLRAALNASLPVLAGEGAEALGQLEAADALAASPDVGVDLRLAVRAMRCLATMYAGRVRDGLALSTDALAWVPADRSIGSNIFGLSPAILVRFLHAAFLRESGRLDDARATLDETEREVQATDEGELRCLVAVGRVDIAWVRRDADAAVEHAAAAHAAAEAVDSDLARGMAESCRALVHLLRREWPEAERMLEASLARLHSTRSSLSDEPYRLIGLSMVAEGLGDLARALRHADEAIEVARRRGNAVAEVRASLQRGQVLLAARGAAALLDVETELDAAATQARAIGCRLVEPELCAARARVARLRGDAAAADRLGAEARALARELGLPVPDVG
jgi:class 3 adenylate cyclase/tetratricopeptide (TPR) repeat protein